MKFKDKRTEVIYIANTESIIEIFKNDPNYTLVKDEVKKEETIKNTKTAKKTK